MRFSICNILAVCGLVAVGNAAPNFAPDCTIEYRLRTSRLLFEAANATAPGATAEIARGIPWGAPDRPGVCLTAIAPNGGGTIPVAITGQGTYDFFLVARQAFSSLTNQFQDFPENGTVAFHTNVTLGARNLVPVPVTFAGHIFMDYSPTCRSYQARAFAQILVEVLGQYINLTAITLPGFTLPI